MARGSAVMRASNGGATDRRVELARQHSTV